MGPDGRLTAFCRGCYEFRLHRARGYGALKAILGVLADVERRVRDCLALRIGWRILRRAAFVQLRGVVFVGAVFGAVAGNLAAFRLPGERVARAVEDEAGTPGRVAPPPWPAAGWRRASAAPGPRPIEGYPR